MRRYLCKVLVGKVGFLLHVVKCRVFIEFPRCWGKESARKFSSGVRKEVGRPLEAFVLDCD